MQRTSQERNLLFATLAVQRTGLSRSQVDEVTALHANNPDFSLAQVLVGKGLLTEQDRGSLDRLVDEFIQAHHGDLAVALKALGNLNQAAASLPGRISSSLPTEPCTMGIGTIPFVSEGEASYPTIDEALGRYTYVSDYAQGGMGRILLVYDQHLGRSVALKELLSPAESPTSQSSVSPAKYPAALAARFLQEARVTGQLEHPSIVPVHELGKRSDGTLYYTMKLVKGRTLSEALKARRSLSERLDLLPNFLDLCQAIAYAHSRGVIHRDIKPANVMVGDFGETVVLDWGLAKAHGTTDYCTQGAKSQRPFTDPESARTPQTAYGKALGTPNYMAPEQAQGLIDSIDERSDVYSLGAVLYEILSGAPPYTGRNPQEVLDKAINLQPEPVLQVVLDAPPELAGICDKALQKDPAGRYQSASELAEDVQRFVTGHLVRAYQYSAKEILRHYYRKHRAVANAVLACVFLVAAISAYSYFSILHARNREHQQWVVAEEARVSEAASRARAERAGYITQLALIQEYLGTQDSAMANRIAWDVLETQRGWEWGFLLNRANPELATISTPPSRIAAVTISPYATLVATVSTQGPVQVWDLTTGSLKATCEGTASLLTSPCQFSSDGTRLVGAGLDGKIRVWEPCSGKQISVLSGHTKPVMHAEFSPDGAQIISASADGTARLWDVATGALVAATEAETDGLVKAAFSPDGSTFVTVSETGHITLWNQQALPAHFQCSGREAVFSTNGRLLATTTDDGTVSLWDLNSAVCLRQLTGSGEICRLRFSRDSGKVLVACRDGNARLCGVEDGRLLNVYPHGIPLLDATFAREDALVITCSLDNDFAVWDTKTGNVVNRLWGRGRSLSNVDFAPNGSRMVTATNEESFQVWDPLYQTGRRLLDYDQPSYPMIAVSEKASLVAKLDTNSGLQLVALDGSGKRAVFTGNPLFFGGEQGVDLADDGRQMAVVLDRFTPSVWDLSAENFVQLRGHEAEVRSIAFDAAGQRVVTASVDGTARIWEAKSGQTLAVLKGHADLVNSARFSRDGRLVVTASRDDTAVIWDAESAQRLLTLRGHLGGVWAAVFSSDGSRVFTASEDRTVRVWDAATGQELSALRGHSDAVTAVSYVEDAHFILTSSIDGTSRLWDAIGMEPLLVLSGVFSVQYLPGVPALVTAQQDGRVERWEAVLQDSAETGDSQSAADQEAFARYRALDHAKAEKQLIPSVMPGKIVIVSSVPTVARCLRELLEQLRTTKNTSVPDPDSTESRQRGGLVLRAFRSLGLQEDDVLLEFCGTAATQRAEVESQLEQIVSGADLKIPGRPSLLLLRKGNRIPVSILVRPPQELSRKVALSRSEASNLIDIMLDKVVEKTSISVGPVPGSPFCYASRNMGTQEGFQLDLYKPDSESLVHLLKASLAPYDLVTAIDNRSLSDRAEAAERLRGLSDEIVSGKVKAFAVNIKRGEFLQLHIEYVIR